MPKDSYDRLDHFMDAYNLSAARRKIIRARVYQAGYQIDDPLAMLVAQDGVIEGRLIAVFSALEALPKQMERSTGTLSAKISDKLTTDIDRRNEAFLDGLKEQVSADFDLAIKQSVAKADVRFFQRAALHVALVCVLSAGLAGTVGYALGRHETQDLAGRYTNVIARPDARTWLNLIEKNASLDTILHENCYNTGPGHLPQTVAGEACAVPLWIGEGDLSEPGTITPYFNALFKSVPSWLTAWVLVSVSLIVGGSIGATSNWPSRWGRREDLG